MEILGLPFKSFLSFKFVYCIIVSFQYLNKSSLKTIFVFELFDIL